MKRNISKALAILMTLALIMTLAAMSAFAVNGGTTTFEKEFAIPDGANMPNVQFEYGIEPGIAVPVSATNEIAIYAGPTATVDGVDYPFIANAVFPSDDNSANNHDNRDGTVDPDNSTKKIYIDNATIDLSGLTFDTAGVYRYKITEKVPPQITGVPGVTYDENTERWLDVFVFPGDHDNNSETPDQLMVTEYSMTKNPSNFTKEYNETLQKWEYTYTDPEARVKSSGYKNELDTVDLTFSKTITGNQANMTDRFDFTLSLSNVLPGTYELELSGDAAAIVGENNAAVTATESAENPGTYTYSITVTDSGNGVGSYTGHFFLTNGESVTVKDLNKGFGYEVQEDEQDYTETNDGNTTGTNVQTDATEAFTNTRTGIIPTGVILTIAPFMIGLLLFGAVMMFMISRRRRATY